MIQVEPWVSDANAARHLAVPIERVAQLRAEGMPHVLMEGRPRMRLRDIDEWLEANHPSEPTISIDALDATDRWARAIEILTVCVVLAEQQTVATLHGPTTDLVVVLELSLLQATMTEMFDEHGFEYSEADPLDETDVGESLNLLHAAGLVTLAPDTYTQHFEAWASASGDHDAELVDHLVVIVHPHAPARRWPS